MTEDQTHYERLGVPPTASYEEISTSYHLLLHRYQSEVSRTGGAARECLQSLELLNEAYAVLSSDVLRSEYDQRLAAAGQSGWVKPAGKEDRLTAAAAATPTPRRRLNTQLDLQQMSQRLREQQQVELDARLAEIAARAEQAKGRRPTLWERMFHDPGA